MIFNACGMLHVCCFHLNLTSEHAYFATKRGLYAAFGTLGYV